MLLESIKTLLARSKKHKPLATEIQSPPIVTKYLDHPIDPTQNIPSDQTLIGTNAGETPDPKPRSPSAGLWITEKSRSQPTESYVSSVSTPPFFPYARDFLIDRPNMTTNITNLINSGTTVLQLLSQKRISGAEVDSSARDPPPKCHHETRKSLRGRVVNWVTNPHRHWRMLWIIGPMGVGKSAVAQTIAEEFNDSGRLGASLFFSRPNQRDDPDGVIPTLAYQLADKYPEYRRIVTERLAGSTSILEKARRIQFKELIIEPFRILVAENAQMVREPLLIILDGLDECKSKQAQCEFVELISSHVRQVENFPLLWMVCSRPEWHLKGMLSDPDFQVTCGREEITIDDTEAQQDVALVLQASFQDIRRKYYDRLGPDWPPETDVRRISVTASGHFAFISTIIKFVGDEHRANPREQLITCIRFLGGSEAPGALNPLHALDLLYRKILSDVPDDILPTTLRILGLSIVYSDDLPAAHDQAHFLCLNQETFYRALQDLHSVLETPIGGDAHHHRIGFYHASFLDYLSDPFRSGSFEITKPMVHLDVAIHSLMWQKQNKPIQGELGEILGNHVDCLPTNLNYDGPASSFNLDDVVVSRLRGFSSRVGWRACCSVSYEDAPRVISELGHFDFKNVEEPTHFGKFLAWLYELGNINKSLIRVASTDWGAGALSVTHEVGHAKDYLSISGVPYDASSTNSSHVVGFLLGQHDNTRQVRVTIRERVSLFRGASSFTINGGGFGKLGSNFTIHNEDFKKVIKSYPAAEIPIAPPKS